MNAGEIGMVEFFVTFLFFFTDHHRHGCWRDERQRAYLWNLWRIKSDG